MNIKKIALAVAATVSTTNVLAVELYNNGGTSFDIGGYFDVALEDNGRQYSGNVDVNGKPTFSESEYTTIGGVSPRLNVTGMQEINDYLTVEAKGEWSTNLTSGGDTTFSTRLGYLALHTPAGQVTVGTQWSPFYNVAGVTDQPILFANNYLYDGGRSGDMYLMGGSRADRMISYQNNFELSSDTSIYFGLGWQGQHKSGNVKTGTRGQIAVGASFAGIDFGIAYMGGDVKNTDATSGVVTANGRADVTSLSVSYGTYAEGLYLAANIGFTNGFYSEKDSDQISALAAYGMDNGVNFALYFETLEHDDKLLAATPRDLIAPQIEFAVSQDFTTFAGYQFHMGDDKADNQWGIGMRYYF